MEVKMRGDVTTGSNISNLFQKFSCSSGVSFYVMSINTYSTTLMVYRESNLLFKSPD